MASRHERSRSTTRRHANRRGPDGAAKLASDAVGGLRAHWRLGVMMLVFAGIAAGVLIWVSDEDRADDERAATNPTTSTQRREGTTSGRQADQNGSRPPARPTAPKARKPERGQRRRGRRRGPTRRSETRRFAGVGNEAIGTVVVRPGSRFRWRVDRGPLTILANGGVIPVAPGPSEGETDAPPGTYRDVRVLARGPWLIEIRHPGGSSGR